MEPAKVRFAKSHHSAIANRFRITWRRKGGNLASTMLAICHMFRGFLRSKLLFTSLL